MWTLKLTQMQLKLCQSTRKICVSYLLTVLTITSSISIAKYFCIFDTVSTYFMFISVSNALKQDVI